MTRSGLDTTAFSPVTLQVAETKGRSTKMSKQEAECCIFLDCIGSRGEADMKTRPDTPVFIQYPNWSRRRSHMGHI